MVQIAQINVQMIHYMIQDTTQLKSNNFEFKSEDDLLDGIIKFDQGIIQIDRIDFDNRIEFKITATLNDPHLKEKYLITCLVDTRSNYLMCQLGYKHIQEILYIDEFSIAPTVRVPVNIKPAESK